MSGSFFIQLADLPLKIDDTGPEDSESVSIAGRYHIRKKIIASDDDMISQKCVVDKYNK